MVKHNDMREEIISSLTLMMFISLIVAMAKTTANYLFSVYVIIVKIISNASPILAPVSIKLISEYSKSKNGIIENRIRESCRISKFVFFYNKVDN